MRSYPGDASDSHAPTCGEIRLQEDEIYLERDGLPGDELDDRLQAERDLDRCASRKRRCDRYRRTKTMSNCTTHFDLGKEAREGEQLRTAIVDSVTHELRTPLTSIKASVTALLTNSRLQPSQRKELLIVISEEADRLSQLVGEAVETAQFDAGAKLDLKPHAIEEIINAARKECKTLLGQRSISLRLPQGLPAARADLKLAKKALMQLLENAAKYSPPDEPISIATELTGSFVMTSVADLCGGIDDSEQTLIFEKFYRGQRDRYRVEGTGMGLHIANAIIKAHGGSLSVTSQRGHGCIFSFTLPVEQQV
jgi:two-component system sensor histidine kinase KdpD